MARALDTEFVNRYARGPAPSTIEQAISLHQNVREVLGDIEYFTLLQGSYKNDTVLWDMNDVDIVAVSRSIRSSGFGNRQSYAYTPVSWDEIFRRIEAKIHNDVRYRGKITRRDKCIRLSTSVNIDIVPAVYISESTDDPIAIYSFEKAKEKQNWPRLHYINGAAKSGRTSGNFKQAVRLFKRWAKCHFGSRRVAPSYYIECLLYSMPENLFTGNLADDFVNLMDQILYYFPDSDSYRRKRLDRIAGDGDLLTAEEWQYECFEEFRLGLLHACQWAKSAITENDLTRAREHWRIAFNGQ